MKVSATFVAGVDIAGFCRWALAVAVLLLGVGGCGTGVGTPDDGDVTDGMSNDAEAEPNNTFSQANRATFDSAGVARLSGTIPRVGDLDVFSLGPLARGDRIVVDTDTTALGSMLDVSVAIFDSQGRLVYNNDDRVAQDLDSYMDWVVRTSDSTYYLVATHSAFAPNGRFTGSYRVDIQVTNGSNVPEPVEQVLMLDFDGGLVNSPTLGTVNMLPFDAGAIHPIYMGQEEVLKQLIREAVEQNYERFNVSVITSDDPAPGPNVEFSTIHFGGFNSGAFGIAEAVDLYNVDYCDDAIIYTESFSPSVFTDVPTVEELAVAIGNIAAHESGHLLGLNHVSDDLAIMDDQSAADAFLLDQEFKEAPLSSDIMSIGTQDAVMLLEQIVGLRAWLEGRSLTLLPDGTQLRGR
jgi:hypothetical protein